MAVNESVQILLAGRAGVYRVLQNLLGNEPNDETLIQLNEPTTWEVLGLFFDESKEYRSAAETIYSIVAAGSVNRSSFIDRLQTCFMRLFVGPGKVEVDPWESMYLSNDGVLFQASTLDVRKAYVASGFIPQSYPHVADDHIALELDFMAQLARIFEAAYSENDAITVKRALQTSKSFIETHLVNWVGEFAETLKTAPHSFFYTDVVSLLVAFIHIDLQALTELESLL
jgi:TorA maturation chaperone TorD